MILLFSILLLLVEEHVLSWNLYENHFGILIESYKNDVKDVCLQINF